MIEKLKTSWVSKYLILMVVFLLVVNVSLGYLLVRQTKASITTLIHTRMLDISNTAAAMIDGDALEKVTPADEGTEDYENIMKTLTYFQDNIDLKYIYCIRDMGDGTFTFGLDPTVEDPGEFGSPIVYTDALYKASKGTPAADEEHYSDAWGDFYSAYSPVFNSKGEVAGIIAVDFDAEWFNKQLDSLNLTILIVAILSLLVGAGILMIVITRSQRKIKSIHGQLEELENTLLQEMGGSAAEGEKTENSDGGEDLTSIDTLEKHIEDLQVELKSQISQVHEHAYQDVLTGVKSKHAYLEMEKTMDEKLSQGTHAEFAIVVCDVNGLKKVNDTKGHKAGDEYLREACMMICDVFSHSPVYRVGGDEFAAVLTGRDYENRKNLMRELHDLSTAHISTEEAIVSGGMSEHIPDQDHCVHEAFERADAAMYKEKKLLKSLGAVIRDEEPEPMEDELDFGEILASSVRKSILIADDLPINREMLGDLLQEDYDILYAEDGVETMDMLKAHKDEIALLILDLNMPIMSGHEVLREMQIDDDFMYIPVIVLTIDQEAELDCLKLGAMDFIPKPYPDIEIVKARIAKCIELSENRALIRYTQRDKLTGLFNIDYFIRYVNRFDQQYKYETLDAVVCDINHFYSINEEYGQQFGDHVLQTIGNGMRKLARRTGGICCRRNADTFLLYCLHQEDYGQLLRKFSEELFADEEIADRVKLRFGVYVDARQEEDVEARFKCAMRAADRVKNDPEKLYGLYKG